MNNIFLDEDFIKTATFDELRKEAKKNEYIEKSQKAHVFNHPQLGKCWESKKGYPIGAWLREWEFYKCAEVGDREYKMHSFSVVLEYGSNELTLDCKEELKSVKLYIDFEFVKDYAENYK